MPVVSWIHWDSCGGTGQQQYVSLLLFQSKLCEQVSKTLQLASALRQNDYYSSEEDEFLDRTGELEKKREKRKRRVDAIFGTSSGDKSSAFSQRAQTYDSLCAQVRHVNHRLCIYPLIKISTIETSMEDLQRQLDALQNETSAKSTTNENEDALDQFMKNVSTTETPEVRSCLNYFTFVYPSDETA